MTTLISVSMSDVGAIQFELHRFFVLAAFVTMLLVALYKKYSLGNSSYLELSEAEVGPSGVKGKFKVNALDQQVGYMFWTELSTRKIGLLVDENNDVIVEVYDSWYEFFKISRELIKLIPVTKVQKSQSTRGLVDVTFHILNVVIRQHLTKWQAKYRRWWEQALEDPENKSLSPQEIQKKYEHYEELIADMKAVNSRLIAYKAKLMQMVIGQQTA